MQSGRCGQAGAGLLHPVGVRQRQIRGKWSMGGGRDWRVVAQRHALRHFDFRTVFIGRECVVCSIAMPRLLQMQEICMIQLHRARMGVDKRRHHLQGDEQPEHQEADNSVRHGQAEKKYSYKITGC
jgi:hypothetical protein